LPLINPVLACAHKAIVPQVGLVLQSLPSSNEYLSVEIECNQKMGITVLGVAGLDNELTWKTYKALNKAEW
jgi:hypothetical protein